jgi:signal transduction histidine kinase
LIRQDDKIICDQQKIKRVFVNLISNACEAMPNGGELTVSDKLSSKTVEIIISDTGQGIPEKIMERL